MKERLLREVGTFGLCVQTEEFDETPAPEVELAIASRYLPADEAAEFLRSVEGNRHVLIRMRPQRWLSQDQSKAG
ncbi:hypothetical protein [Amycolatopsis antarctica]|uniref:hypothetical protein n=1 Tax=Amycolatopsis antarctica TaxID=1854586 RepID=UPI0010554AE3|nr:hypothetical protein [Amycolatopsis antarctica]